MGAVTSSFSEKSRLAALLEHFSQIEDPRDPWRVAHPLPEVLLLAVCGTIADCDDYDHIAAWGEAHLAFLRRFLPYHHGVPGGRWLTILMNRIDPALFSACFTDWVRETWLDLPDEHRRDERGGQPCFAITRHTAEGPRVWQEMVSVGILQ